MKKIQIHFFYYNYKFTMDIEYNAANKKVAYFYNPIISKFVYAK